jgi:hypothetical protein
LGESIRRASPFGGLSPIRDTRAAQRLVFWLLDFAARLRVIVNLSGA